MPRTSPLFVALSLAFSGASAATPPRLVHPPPILRAGVAQIFVDDVLLASKSGVERRVHAAAKLARPVLEASEPWELGPTVKGQPDRRLYIYGTVLRDSTAHRDDLAQRFGHDAQFYCAVHCRIRKPPRSPRMDRTSFLMCAAIRLRLRPRVLEQRQLSPVDDPGVEPVA